VRNKEALKMANKRYELADGEWAQIKDFHREATRYDELAATFMGFVCLASICIWLH
jgi:transposase